LKFASPNVDRSETLQRKPRCVSAAACWSWHPYRPFLASAVTDMHRPMPLGIILFVQRIVFAKHRVGKTLVAASLASINEQIARASRKLAMSLNALP
jgi:hypothetical protein